MLGFNPEVQQGGHTNSERRNNKQPSFSPLMFVISAEGGGDEQLSEAGIQDKYESGGVAHNRRLRRRNDAANAAELMIEFSLASENGLLMLLRRSGLKRQRLCRWPRLAPRLDPRLPARMTAWGGFLFFDELSPGMAGQLYSRAAEQDARAEQRRNNKQPSFSPLMFIISAEGGGDEQLSEAGIQVKYASGVAGHNTRRSRAGQ